MPRRIVYRDEENPYDYIPQGSTPMVFRNEEKLPEPTIMPLRNTPSFDEGARRLSATRVEGPSMINSIGADFVQNRSENSQVQLTFVGSKNDGLTEGVAGSGTVTRYLNTTRLLTNSTANSYAKLTSEYIDIVAIGNIGLINWNDNFESTFIVRPHTIAGADITIFFGLIGANEIVTAGFTTTQTVRHIGFFIQGGGSASLMTSTADGATQKMNTIPNNIPSTTVWHMYRLIKIGNRVSFYMDDNFIAVHYDNIPTAEEPFRLQIGIDNGASTDSGNVFIANNYSLIGINRLGVSSAPVCFLPGTIISTPNGGIEIEHLCIGDAIESLGATSKIADIFVRESHSYFVLQTQLGITRVTGEHPYLFDNGKFVKVRCLKSGDKLRTPKGLTRVLSIEEKNESTPVYNLAVEGPHIYVANGIYVHNKPLS